MRLRREGRLSTYPFSAAYSARICASARARGSGDNECLWPVRVLTTKYPFSRPRDGCKRYGILFVQDRPRDGHGAERTSDKMDLLSATRTFLQDWVWVPLSDGARWVYFNGPSKLGFWHGTSAHEACATLTRVDSDVWERESAACDELLSKDFRAACIGVALIGGGLFVWKLMDACVWSCALRQLRAHKEL